MKTKNLITLLLALMLITGTYSCKYEEGPSLSLKTKKNRVSGTWDVVKITSDDGDVFTPNDNNSIVYTFNKSGSGDVITKVFGLDADRIFDWEFKNSKKDFKLIYNNGDVVYTEILRLTNDEFIVLTSENDRWELKKQ